MRCCSGGDGTASKSAKTSFFEMFFMEPELPPAKLDNADRPLSAPNKKAKNLMDVTPLFLAAQRRSGRNKFGKPTFT